MRKRKHAPNVKKPNFEERIAMVEADFKSKRTVSKTFSKDTRRGKSNGKKGKRDNDLQ